MDPVEEFHRFGQLMPEAMLLVSRGGEVLAANRRASRLFGELELTDVVGRRLAEFTDDGDALSDWLRACARSRSLLPAGLRLRLADGKHTECRAAGGLYRPATAQDAAVVLVRLTPKRDAVDPFLALNLRIEELTAEVSRRRRAEIALHAEREWLHVTLHSIGDAVLATDEQGLVTFMNPVAEKLTAWTQQEARGRPLSDVFVIVNEHTLETVDSPVTTVLREGVVVGLANHTILIARDGSRIPIDDSGAPIRDEHGHLIGVVMVFHDITERRVLERQLEARNRRLLDADRRKDEFLAMLAHELRNPLAPLASGAEILRAGPVDPNVMAELGDMMGRQVQHLTHLVDDLLDVSRITRGRIELHRERVAVQKVLRHAIEMAGRQIERSGHTLTVDVPDDPVLLDGDPTRLAQVFSNLLSNAAKFTDPGGRITLSAEAADQWLTVCIRDTGMGIEPEVLESIFELFAQADRSLDRSQGGLGLGLTVARRVTEMHGGTIEARSDGAGRGSEFIVRIPVLAANDPAPVRSTSSPTQAADGTTVQRVMVVDDNRDAAETLAMLVGIWGHEVRVAHDGAKALEAGAGFAPHVVLLDLGLPGLDGFEVARRMRDHPVLQRARLIAITGYGRHEDRRASAEAGFDDHLTKPVDGQMLARLLQPEQASQGSSRSGVWLPQQDGQMDEK